MRNMRDANNRYEFQLDNKQIVILFAGMVIILILAFTLGTWYGRNLYAMKAGSQGEPATAVALAEGDSAEPAPLSARAPKKPLLEAGATLEAGGTEGQEKQALMEELNAQKLPPAKTAAAGKPGKNPPKKGEPAKTAQAETPAPEKAAPAVTKAAPPPPPAPVSSGRYTIQIAASQNKADADALVAKLREKRYEAYTVKADIPGKGTFYRVRIGHYADKTLADRALRIIRSQEPQYQDAFITE